jgi:hypothetical protein
MKFIYLDWNVIQYIKHGIKNEKFNGPDFLELMKKIGKRYKFPFSDGHLKDLARSVCPENKEEVQKDLTFLEQISQGYAVSNSTNGDPLMQVPPGVARDHLEFILQEKNFDPEDTKISIKQQHINTGALKESDFGYSAIISENGLLNEKSVASMLVDIEKCKDDPALYKKLRKNIQTLKENFRERDTVISKESAYFKSFEPFLDWVIAEDLSEVRDRFPEALAAFSAISHEVFAEQPIEKKIQISYILLDFNPLFSEKINKKNTHSNIQRDMNNLLFAKDAQYFVTEDSATYEKAKEVTSALLLNVRVVRMNELIHRFS